MTAERVQVRRRPADRKVRIISAAGDLFAERGFHNVALADVAEAVGTTAPSLYRHVRNKHDLLLAVVHDSIQGTHDLVASAPDADSLLSTLATQTLDRRTAPILWQREARHLSRADRAQLWAELAATGAQMGVLIGAARPELDEDDATLLAWSLTCVLSSVSFHRVTLPRAAFERLLVELGRSVLDCHLGERGSTGTEAGPLEQEARAGSTREALLNEAVRLFDQRGFRSVSNEEIGEAAGTSGPNIYRHFSSKTDLLVAAVYRAGERRRVATSEALAKGDSPSEQLFSLLDGYIRFALGNRHLLGVLASELDQLPEMQRKASRQSQREFLALWTGLLEQVHPDLDHASSRITVHAVLALIDNLVRTPPLSGRADLGARLAEVCTALLLRP